MGGFTGPYSLVTQRLAARRSSVVSGLLEDEDLSSTDDPMLEADIPAASRGRARSSHPAVA
jgi:hypothetical protein